MKRTSSNNRIRLAIQRSGRLSDDSFDLLNRCGIKYRKKTEQLFHHCENFPLDLLLVRDDDIPQLVNQGTCDLGIVGTNVLEEDTLSQRNSKRISVPDLIQALDFGNCRLSIALPNVVNYEGLFSLQNKRIATSYPNILKKFLRDNEITAEIVTLAGSVEIAPRLGIADAICDLVSTGSTLDANNLQEVAEVFISKAVLIKTTSPLNSTQQETTDLFVRRIAGVTHANDSKYIMLHAPKAQLNDIVACLPGAETPTIVTLENDNNKVGVHAVCRESIFWETLERLKACGASSILVLPIEKLLA